MTNAELIQTMREADALTVSMNHKEAEKLVQAAHAAAEALDDIRDTAQALRDTFKQEDKFSRDLVIAFLLRPLTDASSGQESRVEDGKDGAGK